MSSLRRRTHYRRRLMRRAQFDILLGCHAALLQHFKPQSMRATPAHARIAVTSNFRHASLFYAVIDDIIDISFRINSAGLPFQNCITPLHECYFRFALRVLCFSSPQAQFTDIIFALLIKGRYRGPS